MCADCGTNFICRTRSLAKACSNGDVGTVRQLLDEGRSVHETTEEGESLLSLACSAGYVELAQVRKLFVSNTVYTRILAERKTQNINAEIVKLNRRCNSLSRYGFNLN